MSSEHSDWKENVQEKLQEIRERKQSAETQGGPGPEEQDSDIGFLQCVR